MELVDADLFRGIDDVHMPDPRTKLVLLRSTTNARTTAREFKKYHRKIAKLRLALRVPREIQVVWETALNLMLYSWFVYRFNDLAVVQAAKATEFALRMRIVPGIKKNIPPFRTLLRKAAQMRVLDATALSSWHDLPRRIAETNLRSREMLKNLPKDAPPEVTRMFEDASVPSDEDYLNGVCWQIVELRNILAHGSATMIGTRSKTFSDMRDMINSLYAEEVAVERSG